MDAQHTQVLILSNPQDPHAFAVEAGLLAKGIEAKIWHTADWPILQLGTFEISDSTPAYELRGPEISIGQERVTSLWIRRPMPPTLPENLDPADRRFAFRESSLFLRSMSDLIGAPAFVVNPPASDHLTLLRTAQLRRAVRAGFLVPRTLCSNDPERIRAFVEQTPQGVIFKSFFPMSWQEEDHRAILFTSEVHQEDLSNDEVLASCPGIFQELIPKAYELRVTAIGCRLFAAKILSQSFEGARLDYRVALDEIPMEPYDLPEGVASACRRVLSELEIVFGCFDLIVTPAGEYVFLEVNEMGAFLWVEERLPELRLLDAFCEFLAQGRPDYQWKAGPRSLRAADFSQVVEAQLAAAPTKHVVKAGAPTLDPTTGAMPAPRKL